MPTIRLLLLITGNLRTCNRSMCRTALARSSSSRQQWMPGVITSRAVARRASKLVLRQSFADDVTVGHHADQPVVLSDGNGAYVMLTHQFREFGDRRVWTNPVDALVHCIFDFHGRPPLLKLVYQPRFPSPFDYTTDRFLWHGPQHHRTQEFSYPASPSDSAMSRNASERQLSVKS